MVVDPASEIGDVSVFTTASRDSNIAALRWAAGLRGLVALIALLLAVVAARRLLGRRAEVRVGSMQPEADDAKSLDALEAEAIARLVVPSPLQATVIGAAIVVSLLSFALNAAAFGYAMASHVPSPVVPTF